MEERSPSPPPMQAPVDRRVSNLRRRSSMGQSVRKSRSIIGLPFEDQIAAIGKTIDIFALSRIFPINFLFQLLRLRSNKNSYKSHLHLGQQRPD